MDKIKITTIVENSISLGTVFLTGEHGLSFLIETKDRKILFDTGQGLTFLQNADALGIDLSLIDTLVLSHGHYDHAGGIKHLIKRNKNFTLVGAPEIFENKLAKIGDQYFPIGITQDDKRLIQESGIKVKLEKDPAKITENIMVTGHIQMTTDFEEVEPMFFKGDKGKEEPDLIEDDRSLILNTQKGIVVIFGCAHRGPINILRHVIEITGEKKIYAIMGGMHLVFADTPKLKKIFAYLREINVEKMIVGHCTGFSASAALYGEFGDKVTQNTVGNIIEF